MSDFSTRIQEKWVFWLLRGENIFLIFFSKSRLFFPHRLLLNLLSIKESDEPPQRIKDVLRRMASTAGSRGGPSEGQRERDSTIKQQDSIRPDPWRLRAQQKSTKIQTSLWDKRKKEKSNYKRHTEIRSWIMTKAGVEAEGLTRRLSYAAVVLLSDTPPRRNFLFYLWYQRPHAGAPPCQ